MVHPRRLSRMSVVSLCLLGGSAVAVGAAATTGCVARTPGVRRSAPRPRGRPPASAPAHAPDVAADGATLRETAEKAGLLVGTAVNDWQLPVNPAYREVLAREFNYVTPENCMKWGEIEKRRGEPDYERGDELVTFAEAHGMKVKGHALLWHQMLPGWVNRLPPDELRTAIDKHIREVVGHWKGRIIAWDVVNEAFEDNGEFRAQPFFSKLGEDYIAHAFQVAHEADPAALLFYNDYNAEGVGPKADAVAALAKRLRERGVPISGIGLQMHLDGAQPATRTDLPREIAGNMARLAALGLLVNVSEMDVRIRGTPGSDADRFALQSDIYRAVAAACRAQPRCHGLTLWGFTDAHSWVDGFFGPDDPLPFDEQYRRKPAFYGLREAIARTPR